MPATTAQEPPRARPVWSLRAKLEIAGAVLVAVAAVFVARGGWREYRRAGAIADAVADYARHPAGGEAALRTADAGLESYPDDPSLLLLRANGLLTRAASGSAEAARRPASVAGGAVSADMDLAEKTFETLSRLPDEVAADDSGRRARALGFVGVAAVEIERGRASKDASERAKALEAAEHALEQAVRVAPGSVEPRALLAVIALERGDVDAALARCEEARKTHDAPTLGGALALATAEGEARVRKADAPGAIRPLARAVTYAQALGRDPNGSPIAAGEPAVRLARAIAKKTMDAVKGDGKDEASKAALEEAQRALQPVERRESHRLVPMYWLEGRAECEVLRAIGIAQARAGSFEDARRTLELARNEAPSFGSAGDKKAGHAPTEVPVQALVLRDLGALLAQAHVAETRKGTKVELAQAAAEALRTAADGLEPVNQKDAFEAMLASGELFELAELHDSAILLLRRAEKIDPQDARVLRAIAITLDRWGRKQDAAEGYKRTIEQGRALPGPDAAALEERRQKLLAPGGRR